MTRRSFTVIDVVEILTHWHAGRNKAEVARSLGVDRGTVAKYIAKAEAEGYLPGGEPLAAERWAQLVQGWFPELVDPRERSLTHETIDAHRGVIEQMLSSSTATTVHQRLRDEHGLDVSVTSFRRYLWREFPEENLAKIATPPRPEVPPGEEALCGKPHRHSSPSSSPPSCMHPAGAERPRDQWVDASYGKRRCRRLIEAAP
jgi:hypothetical protein